MIPMEDIDGIRGTEPASIDMLTIAMSVLRRWKLIATIALSTLLVTYGVVKLVVPSQYKSTVEILVYDPQQQIDSTVQKPISPFVEALGSDAINTEINILRSKSVALRVANELALDTDPEFQSRGLKLGALAQWLRAAADRFGVAELAERYGFSGLAERLGLARFAAADNEGEQATNAPEEKAERLDRAADELIKKLDIWQDSYIIYVSATSRDPVRAQRLASSIANDYLASQREARQQALDHVAVWLQGRIDNLRSRISDSENAIEKLKAESGVRDGESEMVKEQQIHDLNTQLSTAHQDVSDKSAHLEQARHVIETNGDIDSIPELTASTALAELRRKKMELNWNLADLQNKFGEHNPQVLSSRAALASVDKQIGAEGENILNVMQNAYDIAVRREQSLATKLQTLTANLNSDASVKLQQLRRGVDTDRKDSESYLAQYNNISEQREMQASSARIISPATLPRQPNSNRLKFYALGGVAGLGGGILLVFLFEYFKPGVRSSAEIEHSYGLPVVGLIPLVAPRRSRGTAHHQSLQTVVNQPLSQLSEAVRALRVNLDRLSGAPKVILVTSSLPGEGKSTAAMLLAASCASSSKKTILVDCDLRLRSTSEVLRRKHQLGLTDYLSGRAKLADVITQDAVTKINVIPAGSSTLNAPDLLMSQEMQDLIALLRDNFDHVIIDSPPLLAVVDALALANGVDKILVVVQWSRTSRVSINESFRVLGPAMNRVAGVVLNKVDLTELPGYGGGYQYYRRSVGKYFDPA